MEEEGVEVMDGKGKCFRLHEDTDPGVEWQE